MKVRPYILNRQIGVADSKYVVLDDPPTNRSRARRMRIAKICH